MVKASKKKRTAAQQSLPKGASTAAVRADDGTKAHSEKRENGARRAKKAKPPDVGISGVPGSKNDSRRCTATANRTGERCRAAAIKGGTVCRMHGGALPQVKRAAKDRLMAMVDPALVELRKIIDRTDASDADKLRAIQMVLDRTGFKPGVQIEVGLSRFDQFLAAAIGMDPDTGQVGIDRDLRDLSAADRPALGPGGGDHSPEDLEQHVYDAQEEIWREQDDEETREYERGRIRPDENTVLGEIIPNGTRPAAGYDRDPGRYDVPPDRDPNDPPRYANDPDEGPRVRRARRG